MTIGLDTIPGGGTPVLDTNGVILNEDPIPEVLPTLIHPGNILTGPDFCPDPAEGADSHFHENHDYAPNLSLIHI